MVLGLSCRLFKQSKSLMCTVSTFSWNRCDSVRRISIYCPNYNSNHDIDRNEERPSFEQSPEDPVRDTQDPSLQKNQYANSPEGSKILKTAVIGPPNVGKSTLINQIMGRAVFAISSKAHTTRCRARGVCIEDKVQLIFLDTPGLVGGSETQKFKLERSFLIDGESSIEEADVMLVVHDVSQGQYSMKLDQHVLRLLHMHKNKPAVLVMNKIDCIKSKGVLLDFVDKLTGSGHSKKGFNVLKDEVWAPKTEFSIQKQVKLNKGWPFFKEVFMVSALDGNGIGDIKEYLLRCAQPGEWIFPRNAFTDQSFVKIIEQTVQAALLDNLPHEVPYNLTSQMEYFDQKRRRHYNDSGIDRL
ncbi:GTPase Era, mitochondrial [Nilaparvata lugens]|uniref:GTPase Era, mitochondrial n=1 Tax=Nilaparvata lugens TaxID=108931 RepID=UPI00193D0AF1|nr:GTPase Era, mitochondrial [Nilaparvata lugens]XP_039292057.1 GTPase Era, mitochondrial [Nilaparvata lugens]